MSEKSTTETVTIRRSPKFLTFFLTGAIAGAILGVIVAVPFVGVSSSTDGIPVYQLVGFFMLFAAAIGALIGLAVALIIDVMLRRSVRTAEAKRTVTTDSSEATKN